MVCFIYFIRYFVLDHSFKLLIKNVSLTKVILIQVYKSCLTLTFTKLKVIHHYCKIKNILNTYFQINQMNSRLNNNY